MRTALVTGAAGFIGYHCSQRLLAEGYAVTGLDCLTDYYDLNLKAARRERLETNENFRFVEDKLETPGLLMDLFATEKYDLVIHLAAQVGVRYSITDPRSYLESNIIGAYELIEAARAHKPRHLMFASTSSAYGANTQMPYVETMRADHQMSFYGATKKANEAMTHSYAHLFDIPTTMFRFFTVYGTWGRPDMALYSFIKAILAGEPIDVYNHGDMRRDFTYIDDLVESIWLLSKSAPERDNPISERDSLSPVAPWRVVNLGNSDPVELPRFIDAIEAATGKKAIRNMMPMQPGDVPATWADTTLLNELTGFQPQTSVEEGVAKAVGWYRQFYNV